MNVFMLKEAIASTALEHPDKCECRVCRATHGDEKAFQEIMFELFDRKEGLS